MKVWKFDRADQPGNAIICDKAGLKTNLLDELKAADIGSSFTVEVDEMTKEDFDKMEEWTGW